jgi:FeS assembly SUF system protein
MPEPLDLSKPGLNPIEKSLLEAEIVEAIRTVYDPEIPVNVYDLGLIYGIDVKDDRSTHVLMTLTSPACPVAGILPGEVETMVRSVPGIGEVQVELTWDPPFTIERMSDDVRLMLGL